MVQVSTMKKAMVPRTTPFGKVATLKWLVMPSSAAPAMRTISTPSPTAVAQETSRSRRGRPRMKVRSQNRVNE